MNGLRCIRNISVLFSLIIMTPAVLAENNTYNYDQIATSLFWKELYTYGGWTLYCGYQFDGFRKTKKGKVVSIEHIYPTDRMLKHTKCNSRMQCRDTNNKQFIRMEADMHNMYPVWQAMVTYRFNLPFGIVSGEEWRFDDCDFEWKSGVAEPRPKARGNIARAIFYMHTQYGVSIEPELFDLLKSWNRKDSPSAQEKIRNDRIEKLQGQRNPYIDDPSLVERLFQGKR